MSNVKSRTPCFVAGCVLVAIIFIVVVVMLSVLFLHIPEASDFSERMSRDGKLHTVLLEGENMDLSQLSEQSRIIYDVLQKQYQMSNGYTDDNGDSVMGDQFNCNAIVEYYSVGDSTDSKSVYGMLIYTGDITVAYDVFITYYREASDQGVDFSNTDYFLFVRGNAIFVGNNRAFGKAYMNNLI